MISLAKTSTERELIMNKKFLIITMLICALLLGACGKSEPAPAVEESSAQAEPVEVIESCTAVIEIENYGSITLELDGSAAPITVANFVKLAEAGFYNGLTFHRIMEGFMMQGGCPLGTGTGGSDTNIKGEFKANGVDNPLSHTRGAISMARAMAPDSASSQFFIVHQDSTFLDGSYAAFGYVTEGIEVVDAVCEDAEPTDNNGSIAKENQPVITSITINR